MEEPQEELQNNIERFQKEKYRLPKEIAWKLQYMIDSIKNIAKPISQLTEDQRNEVKDLEDINPSSLVYVFSSIVNSILSPNLYSSFEKNCKIKLDGLISKWITVYISFEEKEIYFTNRKKIFRFVLEDLECQRSADTEAELKYKGVRKLRIQFLNEQSAKSIVAQINKLIQQYELQKKKFNGEQEILNSKKYQQTLKCDYVKELKIQDNIFLAHKREPKIHVTLFLKNRFWNIYHLAQFLVTQNQWNKKVPFENIYDHDRFLLCQRRWQSSSFFSFSRRTLTYITFTKKSQTLLIIQQKNYPSIPSTKTLIISDIHIKITLQILAPKIIKLSLDCLFNAKGYCGTSSSRSMLIDLFTDVMDIQEKFNKMKDKGKLVFKLAVVDRVQKKEHQGEGVRVCQPKELAGSNVESNKANSEEAYYSIATNLHTDQIVQVDSRNLDDDDTRQFDDIQLQQPPYLQPLQPPTSLPQPLKLPSQKQFPQKQSQYQNLRPVSYYSKITLSYIMLIKDHIFERCYLKYKFNQAPLQNFMWETPWYDPSIIIANGKEYQVNKNNQLIFINYDLIKGQKDSLIFVIKQVGANLLSGKSVLNVSLPVDIFESRTLLQRSAASFGFAPKYLKPVADADVYTQMKSVVGFLASVSTLQLIMLKPFNPILGQTFQAYIGGVPIVYQQISHHPPISAYYITCNEFTIYGNLIAIANVSLNSATGGNAGKMKIIMKNGNVFELSFFPGEISGLIYGKRKYSICHKAFVFQRSSRLVAQISAGKESKGLYEWKSLGKECGNGELIGGIFQVKQKFLTDNPYQKSLMYHSGLKKLDIQQKKDMISGVWFNNISIGEEIINKNMTAYPIQYSKELLPSDSNFRMDVLLHKFNDLARSQAQKEILEKIQRNDRKLRETFAKAKN